MPKDNETIHLPPDGSVAHSEPLGFAPDEMLTCDECLRANPPTRVACIYCEAPLPVNETAARLRKPTLRRPEKHQPGFNCILINSAQAPTHNESHLKAADLLKLPQDTFRKIVKHNLPMPLARTASREEAMLVQERLAELRFSTVVVSDEDLGFREGNVSRPRSLQFQDNSLLLRQINGKTIETASSDLSLVVSGRLLMKKVELKERISRRSENELLDTAQFFADEAVFDLYSLSKQQTWRIGANSFDFSCLAEKKSLVAAENLSKLLDLISSRCRTLVVDNGYDDLRTALDAVWPSQQETHSRGWRREGPGKYSLEAATVSSNESQFTLYSRLRHYLTINRI